MRTVWTWPKGINRRDKDMNIQDLIDVNRLWHRVYPYNAAQAMSYYGRRTGDVLELGSFAGGITFALAETYPELALTIVDENRDYIRYLRSEISGRAVSGRVRLLEMKLDCLTLPDKSFDLVILRGAFFFIVTRPSILTEIYRILRPGAVAFIGGGYGKDTPPEVISEIAEESRVLNDRLGRKRIGINELRVLLASVGFGKVCIVEEGGVWVLLKAQDA